MTTTTYYNLNIVEGTDIVNPLIVDNPNYEKIDEAMHNSAVSGVTIATEITNATVHAITRENSDCAVIRFIATSQWKAGDTATVDGVPVTALLPSGETLPDGAYVINANVLCVLTGTNLTVYVGKSATDANEIAYNGTNVEEALNALDNSLVSVNTNLSTLTTNLEEVNSDLNTQWKKLWENVNPSSAFSSQVVSVDLSKYSLVAIEYTISTGVMRGLIAQCFIGNSIPLTCFGFANNTLYFRSRECTVFSDKVSFADAQMNGVKDNVYCIPLAIYGVK